MAGATTDPATEVRTLEVAPRRLAVVRRRSARESLPRVIPEACGVVWDFVRRHAVPHTGLNVVVYRDCSTADFRIECGVEVTQPFAVEAEVVAATTPAGLVATATHFGPYARLAETHRRIQQWCAAHDGRLEGQSWEVYGHWTDDAARLRTDVFYLLRGAARP